MAFIVIEGLDGSGKSTQLNLLRDYLSRESVSFRYLHFPRLEQGVYGKLIARFLRGELGAIDRVNPYLVALIFAGDRAEAASDIGNWIEEGYTVIADRYVYSNIAYQGAKLGDTEERLSLTKWILELEFENNRLPHPDVNIYLDVPFDFTRQQLDHNRNGEDRHYLRGEKDIHEKDLVFQEKVRQAYHELQAHVDDLVLLPCMDDTGRMQTPEVISEKIIKEFVQL